MKKENKIIVIFGPIAVGKLTIAKKLSAKTGFKLSHNHQIIDLAESIYQRNDESFIPFIEKLRKLFYLEALKSNTNLIITHSYASNYKPASGKSSNFLLKKLQEIAKKNNKKIYFIHLKANEKIILKRLVSTNRKKFNKLTDKKTMIKLFKKYDFSTSPSFLKNLLVLNNSNLTVKKATEKIYNFINK